MGNISSINVQPAKSTSEQHNKREQKLDYVNSEKTHLNFSWEKDSIANVLEKVKRTVKEKTGRSMQKKATPIREGVFNFKEDHTDEEIIEAIRSIEKEFGIKPFQIHLHRDEGHTDVDGKWKPNLHGHVVLNWTNMETGKSFKLDKAKMSELQTFLANALGMERGTSSDKKHLNSLAYKIEAQTQNYKSLYTEVEELEEKLENTKDELENEEHSILNLELTEMYLNGSLEELRIQKDKITKELDQRKEENNKMIAQAKRLRMKLEYFDTKNLPIRLKNELIYLNQYRKENPKYDETIKQNAYIFAKQNNLLPQNENNKGRKMS